MSSAPTRVFISYSHDSREHKDKVWELAERLRNTGIDCRIDQHEESPDKGWPQWCVDQIKDSAFVLVLCTETYARRFEGNEEEGQGKGVVFEGYIITQAIYDSQGKYKKFIPVVFSSDQFDHVPLLLRGPSRYDLSNQEQYQALYWRLTYQSKKPGPVGAVIQRVFGQSTKEPTTKESLPTLERKQTFPPGPSASPPAPSPYFTGRQVTLDTVRRKLEQFTCVALSGMRGVGKTQIAKQYAQSHRKDYARIFWARAEKHETLVTDFASIAQVLELSQKDEKDQSIIVVAVKNWMEATAGWLLILDNADDVPLAQQFVPNERVGRVLLTSTASSFGGWAEKVPVEQMDPEEGALLLLRRAAVIGKDSQLNEAKEADRKVALALGKELGWLPLAIDQAGAYIAEMESTLSRYLELYRSEGKNLRELRGDFGKDHPSVSVTFSLSFQELAKRDPLAANLVRVCAFLAPDAIPEEVFVKGGSALGEGFARSAAEPVAFDKMLKNAATFSLLRRDAPDRSLDIHRLVQEVLKDEMDSEQVCQWAERAVRSVNSAFPNPEFPNWQECERFLPHAKICAALILQFSLEFEEAARLLNATAAYMDDRAQYAEAEPLHQRALVICEKSLGPDHPDVATSLNNLGALRRVQGRYAEAETLYQRALAIREKALGPNSPDVATSLNNLGMLYHYQGRYTEAEPRYRRSLAIWEKALGPEHPNVATSLNNLAGLYHHQGRYVEAEPLFQRSLGIRKKTLGPEHPDVAVSHNDLAGLYRDQGRYAEAEPLYLRSLVINEKALGLEHPGVARSLNSLGALYNDQGRHAEAEPLFQRALAIVEKALGPDHPDVAVSLNNLALLYKNQGHNAEAEPLYTRTIAIEEKALGPDHPDVATGLSNLALLYSDQGRHAEAEPLYKRAIAIYEKALGPDHPRVARILENYAILLSKTGRETEAMPLEDRAKAIREKMKNQAKQ